MTTEKLEAIEEPASASANLVDRVLAMAPLAPTAKRQTSLRSSTPRAMPIVT